MKKIILGVLVVCMLVVSLASCTKMAEWEKEKTEGIKITAYINGHDFYEWVDVECYNILDSGVITITATDGTIFTTSINNVVIFTENE